MSAQTAINAAGFLISIGCIVRANLLFGEIVAAINLMLPQEESIALTGFMRHRFFDILGEYRRHYPQGRLILKLWIWTAVGFACFLGSAAFWFFSGAASVGYILRGR